MQRPRIRTFSVHCREHYGQTVGKIPLDLGLPCPNRARGGCLYCRPASFTPFSLRSTDALAEQIRRGKKHLLKGRFHQYFGYFQQETSTAPPTAELMPLLLQPLADPDCLGLILSTRPDAVAADLPSALAKAIQESGKPCLVELGLQSIHARSLELLNRNHSLADFLDAVARLSGIEGLQVGAHLILGIPGESAADMLATVRAVCALPVQALKLHHLQVIRDTPLHRLHARDPVPLFTLQGYLELLLNLLPHIPGDVTLHRLWSTARPELLVGPQWGCLTGELSARLRRMMAEQGIWQGQAAEGASGSVKKAAPQG